MKAARIHQYNEPVVLEDIQIPNIQPDEILVSVKACGMCRSDVQLVDGYFRRYADIAPPITIGHEIVGVVHKIGSTVPKSAGFAEGDHVVVGPGFGKVGGFAEFVPVPARYLIKVDKQRKYEELAPLTYAGVTPYRGIKKL